MAIVPADTTNLARPIDIQPDQDGCEQTLCIYAKPITDLLAGFSANGAVEKAEKK
jgi:hypothetical protein